MECNKCKKEAPFLSRTVPLGKKCKVWACEKCLKAHYPQMVDKKQLKNTKEIVKAINNGKGRV